MRSTGSTCASAWSAPSARAPDATSTSTPSRVGMPNFCRLGFPDISSSRSPVTAMTVRPQAVPLSARCARAPGASTRPPSSPGSSSCCSPGAWTVPRTPTSRPSSWSVYRALEQAGAALPRRRRPRLPRAHAGAGHRAGPRVPVRTRLAVGRARAPRHADLRGPARRDRRLPAPVRRARLHALPRRPVRRADHQADAAAPLRVRVRRHRVLRLPRDPQAQAVQGRLPRAARRPPARRRRPRGRRRGGPLAFRLNAAVFGELGPCTSV